MNRATSGQEVRPGPDRRAGPPPPGTGPAGPAPAPPPRGLLLPRRPPPPPPPPLPPPPPPPPPRRRPRTGPAHRGTAAHRRACAFTASTFAATATSPALTSVTLPTS